MKPSPAERWFAALVLRLEAAACQTSNPARAAKLLDASALMEPGEPACE